MEFLPTFYRFYVEYVEYGEAAHVDTCCGTIQKVLVFSISRNLARLKKCKPSDSPAASPNLQHLRPDLLEFLNKLNKLFTQKKQVLSLSERFSTRGSFQHWYRAQIFSNASSIQAACHLLDVSIWQNASKLYTSSSRSLHLQEMTIMWSDQRNLKDLYVPRKIGDLASKSPVEKNNYHY